MKKKSSLSGKEMPVQYFFQSARNTEMGSGKKHMTRLVDKWVYLAMHTSCRLRETNFLREKEHLYVA